MVYVCHQPSDKLTPECPEARQPQKNVYNAPGAPNDIRRAAMYLYVPCEFYQTTNTTFEFVIVTSRGAS